MGVLNVTPDSFSDGGLFATVDGAVEAARAMMREGADIVDVGGESTRPGAAAVSAAEERRRVLPVVEALAAVEGMIISLDTYRAETARAGVAAGAHIVNDVWGGQRDAALAGVAAETGAGLCLMHTGREREKLADPLADQFAFLERSLAVAAESGVPEDRIVLDPGFGFAKSPEENLHLMAHFDSLLSLGRPLLVGTSRKRFLGHVTGREVDRRDSATAASTALLRMRGASIFRVHDIAANRDALRLADAVIEAGNGTAS